MKYELFVRVRDTETPYNHSLIAVTEVEAEKDWFFLGLFKSPHTAELAKNFAKASYESGVSFADMEKDFFSHLPAIIERDEARQNLRDVGVGGKLGQAEQEYLAVALFSMIPRTGPEALMPSLGVAMKLGVAKIFASLVSQYNKTADEANKIDLTKLN